MEKIDFLMRVVPHLRTIDGAHDNVDLLKKLETHFQKEEYSKGFHIME